MKRSEMVRNWCRELVGKQGWCFLSDFVRMCKERVEKWGSLDRFLVRIKVWDILVRHGKGEWSIVKDTDGRVKIFRLVS